MSTPELRKIPTKETDLFRELYEVMLLNPFYNDKDREGAIESFREKFVAKPAAIMKMRGGEKDVMSFYRFSPHRLVTGQPTDGRFLIQEEERYFLLNNAYLAVNKEKGFGINVIDCESLRPKEHYPMVIKNIISIISESELSSGDKLLLRDLAIESFHDRLRIASDPTYSSMKTFRDCLDVRFHPNVFYKLVGFGFKMKNQIIDEVDGKRYVLNFIDLRC